MACCCWRKEMGAREGGGGGGELLKFNLHSSRLLHTSSSTRLGFIPMTLRSWTLAYMIHVPEMVATCAGAITDLIHVLVVRDGRTEDLLLYIVYTFYVIWTDMSENKLFVIAIAIVILTVIVIMTYET